MNRFLIATRKSKMALAQTEYVSSLLSKIEPGLDVGIAENSSKGDRDQVSRLDRHGGKGGAFVAEIRADVVAGRTQCAMHSLKDMPGNEETPGLTIGAYLKRDDPTDSLVLRTDLTLEEFSLNDGAGRKIGTNSVRRAAFIRQLFPQAEVIHFRGAADTRVAKLDSRTPQELVDGGKAGPADAILLATSGMARIGLSERASYIFPVAEMLPAVGQGIVAVECAASDWETLALLSKIDDADARACAEAEREVLWILDGHCNSPIAAHATLEGDRMAMDAAVMSISSDRIIRQRSEGPAEFPKELGRNIGLALIEKGAREIIEETRV